MATIRVAGLANDSIVDGPGLRFVIFAQGCPHNCTGCHNPETHPFEGGTEYPMEELAAKIGKNTLLTGVTFSGGEPLCQAEGFVALAKEIKKIPLEIAAYSGYTFEELLEMTKINKELLELLKYIDIIIDGRFVHSEKNLKLHFRGSENQRTIDVKKSLTEGRAVVDDSARWN